MQVRGYRDKLVMLLAKSENDDRLIAALHGGPLLPDQAQAAGGASPCHPPRVAFMRTLPAPPAEQPVPGDASFAANAVKAARALLLRRPLGEAPQQVAEGSADAPQQKSTINIVLDFKADSSACVSIQGTVTSPNRCTITGAQLVPPCADASAGPGAALGNAAEQTSTAPCTPEPIQAAAAAHRDPEPAQAGAEEAQCAVPPADAATEVEAAVSGEELCMCKPVQDAPAEEERMQPPGCTDTAASIEEEPHADELPVEALVQPDAQASEPADREGFAGASAWALLDDKGDNVAAAVPHGIIIPHGQGIKLDLSRFTGSFSQAQDAVAEDESMAAEAGVAPPVAAMPEGESVEGDSKGTAAGEAPPDAAMPEHIKDAEANVLCADAEEADISAGADAGQTVPVRAAEADVDGDAASRDTAEGAIDRVADYLYDYASAVYTPRT